MAFLNDTGTVEEARDKLMIFRRAGIRESIHSFVMLVGSGSSWHDLVGASMMIFLRSSADISGKDFSAGTLLLFRTVFMSTSVCNVSNPSLIVWTFPVKNSAILSARSLLSSISGKHEDLDL